MTDDRTRADDAAYVFHSWSAQANLNALPIVSASGSRFLEHVRRLEPFIAERLAILDEALAVADGHMA